jgi:hypothetical protein
MRPFRSLSGFEGIDTSQATRMAVNEVLRRCGPGVGAAFNQANGHIMFFLGAMDTGIGRPFSVRFVTSSADSVVSELNLRKADRRDKDAWAKQHEDREKHDKNERLEKDIEEVNRTSDDFLNHHKDKLTMGRHYKRSITV